MGLHCPGRDLIGKKFMQIDQDELEKIPLEKKGFNWKGLNENGQIRKVLVGKILTENTLNRLD